MAQETKEEINTSWFKLIDWALIFDPDISNRYIDETNKITVENKFASEKNYIYSIISDEIEVNNIKKHKLIDVIKKCGMNNDSADMLVNKIMETYNNFIKKLGLCTLCMYN